jgi:hypothetical protein
VNGSQFCDLSPVPCAIEYLKNNVVKRVQGLTLSGSSQDGFIGFKIFLDGVDGAAGIGDADSIGLAEFVMHEEFADHADMEIGTGHMPNLTGDKSVRTNARGARNFYHAVSCALTGD